MNGVPGVLGVAVLAAIAVILSKYVSLSGTLIAIMLGFALGNIITVPTKLQTGIKWCESQALSIAVALLGVNLNVFTMLEINAMTLLFIISSLALTFSVTFIFAKILNIQPAQACLVASGQGICGSAAVMATQKIIKAPTVEAGLVVAVVNFLGFVGVFLTAWMAPYLFTVNDSGAGLLIGNTLQSMGNVVAAGFSVNDEVGHLAVLVKMCRILLLIPVLLLLILYSKRAGQVNRQAEPVPIHWVKLVPLFIWVFLVLSFMSSMQWIPPVIQTGLSEVSGVLFLLAMVAIGLAIKVKDIYQQGGKLLILGMLVFSFQLLFSVWFLSDG
ncbi:YeiH family protein [Marinicella litoralis]|nr:putative sulfate exporter family transporter [Marinicella litoralis]